jgi:hypothetical protein
LIKAKSLEEKDINNPFIVVNNFFVLSPPPTPQQVSYKLVCLQSNKCFAEKILGREEENKIEAYKELPGSYIYNNSGYCSSEDNNNSYTGVK